MFYIVERFGWAIMAAAVLGLLFEGIGGPGRASLSSRRLTQIVALTAIPVAGIVSGLQLVPGRPGLWLDAAVVIAAGYAIGCLVAAAIRNVVRARRSPEEPASDDASVAPP